MSMPSQVVMKDNHGLQVIVERMMPIPAYDVEDTVGYRLDPEDKNSVIESKIIGITINVFPCGTNQDGDILYESHIEYEMENNMVVPEEDIDYYFTDDERDPVVER